MPVGQQTEHSAVARVRQCWGHNAQKQQGTSWQVASQQAAGLCTQQAWNPSYTESSCNAGAPLNFDAAVLLTGMVTREIHSPVKSVPPAWAAVSRNKHSTTCQQRLPLPPPPPLPPLHVLPSPRRPRSAKRLVHCSCATSCCRRCRCCSHSRRSHGAVAAVVCSAAVNISTLSSAIFAAAASS